MIISLMGNFGKSYGQTCDEVWISRGLKELGIEVFENEIPERVDLILGFKSNKFGAEQVKEWKKKAPVWLWTFDNCDRFAWVYPIIKECDLWLGEELGRRERFIQEGLPFYYFPYHAVPPNVFKPLTFEKEYDVVFTGTPYDQESNPNKFELLKAIDDKFDLHIFGNNPEGWKSRGFKNVHEPAFDEKLSEVYGKSEVAVAISNCQCEGYWSIRTSQCLMCGIATLTRFTPQMEKELKDSVTYFQDIPTCLAKIDYLLSHEAERKALAERGHAYARILLTPVQRLKELLILYENRDSITRFKRNRVSASD